MTNRVPQIRVTAMPTDLNPYGGVFGGWLMSQMALGAGSLASREGQGQKGSKTFNNLFGVGKRAVKDANLLNILLDQAIGNGACGAACADDGNAQNMIAPFRDLVGQPLNISKGICIIAQQAAIIHNNNRIDGTDRRSTGGQVIHKFDCSCFVRDRQVTTRIAVFGQ